MNIGPSPDSALVLQSPGLPEGDRSHIGATSFCNRGAKCEFSGEPFRHWIVDAWCQDELIRAALAEWPDSQWPHWHLYDDANALKYATRDASHVPSACWQLLLRMAALPVEELTGEGGLFPDLMLHGAGLHMLPLGGFLRLHRDAQRHPQRPWIRRLSATLFVNEQWRHEWGGPLELWSSDGRCLEKGFDPVFARLVLFETAEASYHGVPTRVACPVGDSRKTLSLFWWSFGASSGRTQSEFV